MLAGHRPKGTTSSNYAHLLPTYLRAAIATSEVFSRKAHESASAIHLQ